MLIKFDPATCSGVVEGEEAKVLEELWIGDRRGERLVLNALEVSYLLLEKRGEALVGNVPMKTLEELMLGSPNCFRGFFWPSLSVYKDLRDRGRRVRALGDNLFLVKDARGGMRLVVVLEEKSEVGVSRLVSDVDRALKNDIIPVVAIVSLQGDITYYEVSNIEPAK